MKFQFFTSRPWIIHLIALGWLIVATFYSIRAVITILQWDFLSRIYYPYAPLHICLSGILWGIIGLCLSIGLWYPQKWILWMIRIITILFSTFIIFECIAIFLLGNWSNSELIYPIISMIFTGFVFYGTNLPEVISFVKNGAVYVKR